MSVRPISGWLKVGLPIKMRTIKPPMGKWYKYCFNFKTDFWLMTKLILFLLIKNNHDKTAISLKLAFGNIHSGYHYDGDILISVMSPTSL